MWLARSSEGRDVRRWHLSWCTSWSHQPIMCKTRSNHQILLASTQLCKRFCSRLMQKAGWRCLLLVDRHPTLSWWPSDSLSASAAARRFSRREVSFCSRYCWLSRSTLAKWSTDAAECSSFSFCLNSINYSIDSTNIQRQHSSRSNPVTES